MLLKPHNAIHHEDMERYENFMSQVKDHHYLDMYFKDDKIHVDIFEYPADTIVASGLFEPSSDSHAYFEQQENFAREMGIYDSAKPDVDEPQASQEGASTTGDAHGLERRAGCSSSLNVEFDPLSERASRCRQFCGIGANCVRNCPRCYYVGGACRWQKWCI
ncbi:hypothetical protein N7478_012523 [Penicillium angulare]|uniref:uncharacterized protein n=1 Tax=Penicillium angulare TaxID=116970 RepID=UPI0025420BC0|nr:uncharacterized protein N7478_012523 [Penicillium angulare]KAJ5259542.1 hypothetical protein N7478_012523 [Penicillium angulare]